MRIESTSNERIKAVRRLHRGRERRRTNQTLIEGPNLVAAALEAGIVPRETYTVHGGGLVERCEAAGSTIVEVSSPVLEVISTTVEPQDPVGVISIPGNRTIDFRRTLVAVEISDPGNLGALVRSAVAFGWQIALLSGADEWSPRALRSGAGAHFAQIPVRISDLSEIIGLTATTVATVVSGGRAPYEIERSAPIALLIGSESGGLPAEIVAQCDQVMTLPMEDGIESLNAAVAGGIAMYALTRPERAEDSPV